MISINVRGNRPGPCPSFPEHVDARAGGVGTLGTGGKQGGTLSVLSCGLVEMQIALLPQLQPHVREGLPHFYLSSD